MPVWLALGGTLAYNVSRHLRGKSTLCSSGRTVVPAWAMETALDVGVRVLKRHYRNGFNA